MLAGLPVNIRTLDIDGSPPAPSRAVTDHRSIDDRAPPRADATVFSGIPY